MTRCFMPPESWCGYSSTRRCRVRDTDIARSSSTTRSRTRLPRLRIVQPHRLGDLLTDRHHRVQRGHRLLEDHAHAPAALPAHLRLGQGRSDLPCEQDLTRDQMRPPCGKQPHDRQRDHRLAAAGLAEQHEGLAGADRKATSSTARTGVLALPRWVVSPEHLEQGLRGRASASGIGQSSSTHRCSLRRGGRRHRARHRRTGSPPAPA
jgi:hypothetical protein